MNDENTERRADRKAVRDLRLYPDEDALKRALTNPCHGAA
jgi:hypothetical protein